MPGRPSPWREEFSGELQQVNWWIPVEVAEMLRTAAQAYRLGNATNAAIIAVLNTYSSWQPGDNEVGELAKRTGLFPDANDL